MVSEPMMASGRFRDGLTTSSPEVDTASNPMYAKKIAAAAVVTPWNPLGENGVRLSALNAVKASARNSSSTTSLTSTMIVLARALSLIPTISSAVTASTRNAAGRLTVPPSPGGSLSALGRVTPNSESSRLLRYCPQPTATAATDTPYSRMRSQPMIQATSSPSVAYA